MYEINSNQTYDSCAVLAIIFQSTFSTPEPFCFEHDWGRCAVKPEGSGSRICEAPTFDTEKWRNLSFNLVCLSVCSIPSRCFGVKAYSRNNFLHFELHPHHFNLPKLQGKIESDFTFWVDRHEGTRYCVLCQKKFSHWVFNRWPNIRGVKHR